MEVTKSAEDGTVGAANRSFEAKDLDKIKIKDHFKQDMVLCRNCGALQSYVSLITKESEHATRFERLYAVGD
jgi:hypothetical protein